jgi:hypothetical protein
MSAARMRMIVTIERLHIWNESGVSSNSALSQCNKKR